jgi:hypothetical protein
MDIRGRIVDTARRIALILGSEGPQDLVPLGQRLNEPIDIVHLALGWLARDDKIEIRWDVTGCQIRLKTLDFHPGFQGYSRHKSV